MSDIQKHYLDGLKAFGENRYDDALVAYEHALAIDPDNTDILSAKAKCLSDAGRQQEAITTIERVIELDKNDAFAFTSLSIFLMRDGKIPEAEAAAAKARMISWKEELKTNPDAVPPGPPGSMNVIQ